MLTLGFAMKKQTTIGLFFGTFNPIHIGHLVIANYIKEYAPITELWFVISPQSPFKKNQTITDDRHRLEMVNLAIDKASGYRASDIEFYMPKPSYTIDTIGYLMDKYPTKKFSIIMGADNLATLHQWKNAERLVELCQIIVYPRPGYEPINSNLNANVLVVNAPLMEISSSFIREAIKEKRDVQFFLPPKVWDYICKMDLYR